MKKYKKKPPPQAATSSVAPQPTGASEERALEKLPRHIEFLRWYLGRPHDTFSKLRQYKTIGLSVDHRRKSVSASLHPFHRFAVLSVEGDCCFDMLEASGRPESAPTTPHECIHHHRLRGVPSTLTGSSDSRGAALPNATMCCLHYGNGTESFPLMAYRVILAQNTIFPGEVVRLCPLSVVRCDDEFRFYAQYASTTDAPVTTKDVAKYWTRSQVAMWPDELPYYHGIGARHVAKDAVVSFPSNLLSLRPCPALGEGQLQVVAAEYLHEGTCFLYGGAARETFVRQAKRPRDPALRATHTELPQTPHQSTTIAADEVYSIYLSTMRTCVGQNITRFINHRFHMSGFGNVVLVNMMIPVARDDEDIKLSDATGESREEASAPTAVSVSKDRNYVFLNIPFFITKTPVYAGSQLTTNSYGPEYDAKLERIVMTNMSWVPFVCTARIGLRSTPLPGLSPAYTGTYLASLEVGSFVWRPTSGHKSTPWMDLFVIEKMDGAVVLLRSLVAPSDATVKSATTAEGNDLITIPMLKPSQMQGEGHGHRRYICARHELAWLLEGVDYELASVTGGGKVMKLWYSWIVESTILVYEHMESNRHWFAELIPFVGP